MKIQRLIILAIGLVFAFSTLSFAAETVLFGFEKDTQGWEVPDWALEKEDHVAESMAVSNKYANEGTSALEIMANFPGGSWTGAYVEIQEYFDWSKYSTLSVDVYIPENAPPGLKAKFILTVGDSWEWTEMSRGIMLVPGKWTTIKVNLKPGSLDFRKGIKDDTFRQDIRKLGFRVESNMKPAYKGPIYIDNIKLSE